LPECRVVCVFFRSGREIDNQVVRRVDGGHPVRSPQLKSKPATAPTSELVEGMIEQTRAQPGAAATSAILSLQKTAGNQAVASVLQPLQRLHAAPPGQGVLEEGNEKPSPRAPERASREPEGGRDRASTTAGASRSWRERVSGGLARLQRTVGSRLRSDVQIQRCSKAKKDAVAALPEKTVTVDVTYLQGGSTDLGTHVAKANSIYKQANVKVASGKQVTLDEAQSKKILGEDLILNEYNDPASPTAEELELLKQNRTSGKITMYYVKALSQGSIGEAFWPGVGQVPGFVYASSNTRTWPHELGHVLLNDGGHPGDSKNFMAQTSTATGEELMTEDQVKRIRGSSHAS
jgi:hypothetical protein